MLLNPCLNLVDIQVCKRCIYDERVSGISFSSEGICNYCQQIDMLTEQYGTGERKGKLLFENYIEDIKKAGHGKPYDCIIGVSGGTDSSYMLYLAKEYGLRPLAVHYDNTWNSAVATENIRKVLSALNIDLYTHVVDNKEADRIFKAFFFSGVAEIEASTDLALAEVMYRVANKYKLSYVFEGHSFITEGVTPVGRNYFDGKYIKSIYKMYNKEPLNSYPLMTFSKFLRWSLVARIRKIRPFWYLNYDKEAARSFLETNYGWQYYGGHHLENRMTAFYHSVYLPQKFKADLRNNTLSARVRCGSLTREKAWAIYNEPLPCQKELINFFKKRLKITDEQYQSIMQLPPKNWYEFPTYKKRFERLRPIFKVLAHQDLVPMSFYLKYCFPMPEGELL